MHNTENRVRLVKLRIEELHKKNEKRQIAGLGFLSGLLGFSLLGTINAMTGGLHGGPQEVGRWNLFGAILLYEDAGGYVLVGVVSFMLAVVITISCIRGKKKNEK